MTQYVLLCSPVLATDKLKDFIKGEHLKFKDGSSKLLLGNKFQDRYLVLQDKKLLLYKDIKVRLLHLHFQFSSQIKMICWAFKYLYPW